MKRLLAVLSVGALAALVVPTTAGAQSLNDIPTLGPEICGQWQAQLDAFKDQAEGAGTPFAEIHGGVQTLHDNACAAGGGEEPPEDDGDDDANPLCAQLEEFATQAEAQPSPGPEFADGLRQIAEGMDCPAASGSEEETEETEEEADDSSTDDTTTTTAAEVAGATASNDGGALPASGGGLLAGGAGLGLVALATLARRLFGAA